jgi:hypothetical protein
MALDDHGQWRKNGVPPSPRHAMTVMTLALHDSREARYFQRSPQQTEIREQSTSTRGGVYLAVRAAECDGMQPPISGRDIYNDISRFLTDR